MGLDSNGDGILDAEDDSDGDSVPNVSAPHSSAQLDFMGRL